MNSVTHIAGPAITACGRLIQRCSLCGDKLVDSKNCMVPVKPDGTFDPIPTWEVGRLIQVTAVGPGEHKWMNTRSMMLPDTDKLPDDTCLELVE